ncbi:MAG: hypothetical protein L6R35_003191 [Caloplaca aegaea]|nr:MAG: hypothetical protein L6R35_003191 [Caloplaca aegaea]
MARFSATEKFHCCLVSKILHKRKLHGLALDRAMDVVEVPADLPPSDDPQERAKHASGMRLNLYTANEIGTLKRLTAAGCSATPTLLAVKVDMQTESDLGRPGWVTPPWMPGGYIVYILMVKIPAQPLDYTFFWRMTQNERNEVRIAFRKAFLSVNGPLLSSHID